MTEAMVTMAEVATAMGRKPAEVEAEARALNLTIRPDWMNRPALSVAEARGLTTGEARRNLEHEAAWRQHQVDTKAWTEGRSQRSSPKPPRRCGRRQAPDRRDLSPRRPGMPPSRPVSSTKSATHGRCSATASTPSACSTPRRCRHDRIRRRRRAGRWHPPGDI